MTKSARFRARRARANYWRAPGFRYLDALASDERAPLDVRIEVGRGYTRLAQVVRSGASGQLGKFADANALLAKAEAVLAGLHARAPRAPDVVRAYVSLLIEQSAANPYNNNELETALRQATRARELSAPMRTADTDWARLYSLALMTEGESHVWIEDFAKARDIHLQGEAFYRSLPAAMRDAPGVIGVRSASLRSLGEAHHKLKEAGPARAVLDEAVAVNERPLGAKPEDPALLRKLTVSLWYRAVVHRTNMRDALAA